jgi:hypothetical protein
LKQLASRLTGRLLSFGVEMDDVIHHVPDLTRSYQHRRLQICDQASHDGSERVKISSRMLAKHLIDPIVLVEIVEQGSV